MVRPALQLELTQHPITAASGALAASSRAIVRISGATALGRSSSARAISLGDRLAARSSRTRASRVSSSGGCEVMRDLVPGGVAMVGEAGRDTRDAVRELAEETGISTRDLSFTAIAL